jgi:hypothetical protein
MRRTKRFIGIFLVGLLGVIGPVPTTLSQSQHAVAPDAPYGACAGDIDNLTAYGGAAFPVVSVRANPDPRTKSLSFAYEVNSEIAFIEASYLDTHRLLKHYNAVDRDGGWLVIASRSALKEVQSGALPRLFPSETDPGRQTTWFAEILSFDGTQCVPIYIFARVFEEDVPQAWPKVQPTLRSPM